MPYRCGRRLRLGTLWTDEARREPAPSGVHRLLCPPGIAAGAAVC